jgi:hypothetical protein
MAFGKPFHHLKAALRRKPIPNLLASRSFSVVLLKNHRCCASAKGLFTIKASHAGIMCSCNKVRYTSPLTPLLFGLMPLLPIVTNKGILPYLLTPPYACTLKQLFCYDTLVGGSSSKSTHSVSWAPYWSAKSTCCLTQPHCAMIAIPIVWQSTAVRANDLLLVKDASSASFGASSTC